mgnify:CR=1 FL=1
MDIVMSPLQFHNYFANKILFELNDKYENEDGKVIELNPIINKEISDCEDKKFSSTLSIKIDNEEEPNTLPFKLEISITGLFEVDVEDPDCKDSLVKNNSIIILLPYLRSLVTSVTAGANIPPLVLPVLNLNSLFDE